MDAPKPPSETHDSRDGSALWILIPFALAVVFTVVMLFTNSANMLKVSLVLALWAAVAGMILVARLRRERENAERELVSRSERFEAQLDAAQARGEADRASAALARNDATSPAPGVDVEVLREIQAELARLRTQLEELSGRQFEYEPAALRAQARRVAELEGAAGSSKYAPTQPAPEPEPIKPEPEPEPAPEPESTPRRAEPVSTTRRVAGPSTDDTARIKKVPDPQPAPEPARTTEPGVSRPVGAPSVDAIAGRVGSRRETLQDAQNPLSQLISQRQSEAAPKPKATPKSAAEPKPAPTVAPQPEVDAEAEHHGGRRRRDEHGRSSLTVAELLARSKRETD